jgi:hypothetical protein
MKMISLLTAAALLVAGSAYAAAGTAPATAAAPPATTSAPAPATAAAKQDHHCRDEANEKKLAGAARSAFVKKCRADSMKK